jgi:hypothetical protein
MVNVTTLFQVMIPLAYCIKYENPAFNKSFLYVTFYLTVYYTVTSHQWGNYWNMITANGIYPWPFVTDTFLSD